MSPQPLSGFDFFTFALVTLVWGGSWHIINYQFGDVPIETSLAYRFILGALLLLPFLLAMRKRQQQSPLTLIDHIWIASQGMMLFSFSYWIFYRSVADLSSGLVAILFCFITIFNACNQSIFFKFPVERKVLVAAVMGIAGVALFFAPDLRVMDSNPINLGAVALCLCATYLASLGNMIALRNYRAGISPLTATTYGMAYGGGSMLVFCLLQYGDLTFDTSPRYIISLIYLSAIASSLAFTLYLGMIARIGAARGAYVAVLIPIVALTISSVFEDFLWSVEAGIGILLILAGNLLVLSKPRKKAAYAKS